MLACVRGGSEGGWVCVCFYVCATVPLVLRRASTKNRVYPDAARYNKSFVKDYCLLKFIRIISYGNGIS